MLAVQWPDQLAREATSDRKTNKIGQNDQTWKFIISHPVPRRAFGMQAAHWSNTLAREAKADRMTS